MLPALNYLANHLLLAASGTNLLLEHGYHYQDAGGVVVDLRHGAGQALFTALETHGMRILKLPPRIPRDVVVDDLVPSGKRISMTIELWKERPIFRVFIDRPVAGSRSGPYGAAFELDLPWQPSSFLPQNNQDGGGLRRWIRGFLTAVYPQAPQQEIAASQTAPLGVPFVDVAWPNRLDPRRFGIDELRITVVFNPQTQQGAVESVEMTFSSPGEHPPLPAGQAVPGGIPPVFLFQKASPDGVSVELKFGPDRRCQTAEIDGALLFFHEATLPLHWSSREPSSFSGALEVEEDNDEEALMVRHLGAAIRPSNWILDGLERLPLHQAELTFDLDSGVVDFTGQCARPAQVRGVQCSDLVLTIKGRIVRDTFLLFAVVLRGIATLPEETYFRAAAVFRDVWITALEANHSTQKQQAEASLAALVEQLPRYRVPVRRIGDTSAVPQLLRLDEQRRGSENEFDELLGE